MAMNGLVWSQQAAISALRQQLWASGYRPVPVYSPDAQVSSPGKRPVGDDWTGRARQNPPEAVTVPPRLFALNTGILCDGLIAIDIDIDDPDLADQVEKLATEMLGGAPVRYREDSQRRLGLYRAAEGEPAKRTLSSRTGKGKIEVLGRGQQFVAYGTHPDGAAYRWRPADPAPYHRDKLTAVTEAQMKAFLTAVAPLLGADPPKACDRTGPGKRSRPGAGTGGKVPPTKRERAYAAKALEDEVATLAAMQPGSGRNQALYDAAFRLGQMVGAGWTERQSVGQALLEASEQNGYRAKDGDSAAWSTLQSGLKAGMRRPTQPLAERDCAFFAGLTFNGIPIADLASGKAKLKWPPDA